MLHAAAIALEASCASDYYLIYALMGSSAMKEDMVVRIRLNKECAKKQTLILSSRKCAKLMEYVL